MLVRVGELVRGEVGAALHHQPLGVDQPAALARRVLGDMPCATIAATMRSAMPVAGLARAEEQEALVRQLAAGDAQRREKPGQRDRRRALDVVVEGADAVAVFLQQAERVVVGEVLELDQHARETLPARR